MSSWSPQQEKALALVGAWLKEKDSPVFYLAGYAGTGKTTLAKHIAQDANGRVAFAAFTGKAASVLKSKGCIGAKTIHRTIYNTIVDPDTGKVSTFLRPRTELAGYALFIIDECSMVDEKVGADLLSFGVPVLVLGDPAQLPPVTGGGFFTGRTPDFLLSEVHRQALDSNILRLATLIREGGYKVEPMEAYDMRIVRRGDIASSMVSSADMIIVGRNNTRQSYNQRLRELRGYTGIYPNKDEPLICLKNDRELGIANGDILWVRHTGRGGNPNINIKAFIEGGDDISLNINTTFFHDDVAASKLPYKILSGTQQATYGHAITCHKSQGSQWDNVCLFDESYVFRDSRKEWLYTAVTRAAKHLTLVI